MLVCSGLFQEKIPGGVGTPSIIVNIFLKTLYQIKAFNIFFIMEFTP
jgi:hypothetical protein